MLMVLQQLTCDGETLLTHVLMDTDGMRMSGHSGHVYGDMVFTLYPTNLPAFPHAVAQFRRLCTSGDAAVWQFETRERMITTTSCLVDYHEGTQIRGIFLRGRLVSNQFPSIIERSH